MGRKTFEGTGLLPGIDVESQLVESPSGTRPEVSAAKAPGSRRAKESSRFTTPRIVGLSLVAMLAFGVILFGFYRAEQFLIRDSRFTLNGLSATDDAPTLEITGASHASRHAIEAVFSGDQGRSVYLIPLFARRDTLRSVDWVRDASVARIWPNHVIVQVAERTPVAFVTLTSSRYALIDEDGVILPPTKDRFALPVLTGVHPTDTLSVRRERVRRMLGLLSDLAVAGRNISEIDVSDRDNLKVSQPYEGRILTMLLGDHNFAARYGNFVSHYKEIESRLPGATTLDLRLEDRITVVE